MTIDASWGVSKVLSNLVWRTWCPSALQCSFYSTSSICFNCHTIVCNICQQRQLAALLSSVSNGTRRNFQGSKTAMIKRGVINHVFLRIRRVETFFFSASLDICNVIMASVQRARFELRGQLRCAHTRAMFSAVLCSPRSRKIRKGCCEAVYETGLASPEA